MNEHRHQSYGQQFGFDHYDLPPGRKSILEKVFGETIARKASNPVVATVALLACGAVFAGIIMAAYPGGESADQAVPLVKAETTAYKTTPDDPGGMEIPNRGSTIFQTMADGSTPEPAPIENLLAEEKPIDKLAAFQRQVEEITSEEEASKTSEDNSAPADATANLAEVEDRPAPESAPKELIAETEAAAPAPAQEQLASVTKEIDIPEPKAPEAAAAVPAEKPEITTPAGSNPETLAYVRSVLDRKDGVAPSADSAASSAASVEPAAGAAGAAKAITPGSYYIQLGSVTSASGASSEWGKLQKSFSSQLSSLDYRVQEANLGDRGTFYRIQAGPMSKESASALCDEIKAQKPGGCLVTQ